MEKRLLPIYALRVLLLKRTNPKYFNDNRDYILRTSLAAQDYVLSGNCHEYHKPLMGHQFKNLPEYVKVHKKYKLPYDPNLFIIVKNTINPGLVMDLAWSLQTDKTNGIIDSYGNIKKQKSLSSSEVLQVYHNTTRSGVPINALNAMTPEEVEKLLSVIHQKTK